MTHRNLMVPGLRGRKTAAYAGSSERTLTSLSEIPDAWNEDEITGKRFWKTRTYSPLRSHWAAMESRTGKAIHNTLTVLLWPPPTLMRSPPCPSWSPYWSELASSTIDWGNKSHAKGVVWASVEVSNLKGLVLELFWTLSCWFYQPLTGGRRGDRHGDRRLVDGGLLVALVTDHPTDVVPGVVRSGRHDAQLIAKNLHTQNGTSNEMC